MSIYVFSYFPFGFEGRIWDLIVSVPDHCLSFYFVSVMTSVTLRNHWCRKLFNIGGGTNHSIDRNMEGGGHWGVGGISHFQNYWGGVSGLCCQRHPHPAPTSLGTPERRRLGANHCKIRGKV